MLVYSYSKTTGEYAGSEEAMLDPIEKQPMIPARATTEAPPTVQEGEIAVFVDGAWVVMEDHRGFDHWAADGTYLGKVENVGSLPDGAVLVQPEPTEAQLATTVRADRDQRLAVCDWTQLPDAPLTEEERAAWATYRQALRDVPAQDGFPTDIAWPDSPK